MPVDASRCWFIAFNAVAILLAAYLLLRLFNFSLTSVAAPALLLAMFCTEIGDQHAGVHQHQRLPAAGRGAVLPVAAVGQAPATWWAGVAIGLTLVVKPILAPLLLLPLLNRQWRVFVTAFGVPLVLNAVALAAGRRTR